MVKMSNLHLKNMEEYCAERKELLQRVKKIIINNLNLDLNDFEIDDDSGLFGTGLGLDSIDALDLVIGVEEEFGIKIGENELKVFRSVNSLVDYIYSKLKKIQIIENVESEEDINDGSAYYYVRNKTTIYEYVNDIYEIPAIDDGAQLISNIVAGKTISLEPNKCIQSLILNENGRIVDVVYVMMFDEKYWILTSKGNDEAKKIIMTIPDVKCITNEYKCITIEGPYAWSVAKRCFGFEILGLTYARFIDLPLDDITITVARLSVTGEYGYRIFVAADMASRVTDLIKNESSSEELKEIDEEELKMIMKKTSIEGRAVQQNSLDIIGINPVENELRWMIDLRKASYIGKEVIESELQNCTKRVVAFVVEGKSENEIGNIDGKSVAIGSMEIGTIVSSEYSPILKKRIGYCSFNIPWGYVGISGLSIVGVEGAIIKTVSTPVFIPKSAKIQVQ